MAALSILRAGMFTTVQDLGRWGFQSRGVPVSGALDWYSHRLANRLLGNDAAMATLEVIEDDDLKTNARVVGAYLRQKLEGLKAPVAGGPLLLSQISRMMMLAFAEGWVQGGKLSAKIVKPAHATDFTTAKGIIREKIPEGSAIRFICDVWVEKQTGEKAIVGTASGLVR